MFEIRLPKELKRRKIALGSKREIEPQEILLDRLAQKKESDFGISKQKFEVPLSQKVLWSFLFLIIFLILILFAKTFYLQVFNYRKFLALAEGNKFIIRSIQAARGVIYDSRGEQLVFNKPSFDLILRKDQLPESEKEKKEVLGEVSRILEKPVEELEEKIESQEKENVLISQNLDYQRLIVFEAKISQLPGFEIKENLIREYKDGQTFSHLIGYTGKIDKEELNKNPEIYSLSDYVGQDGLEKSYEDILRKNSGKLQVERDAIGNPISKETISLPVSGKSLTLWLEAGLQKKIENELGKTLERLGAQKGLAVALDPKSGGIKALVSIPNFDNNLFSQANPQDLENLLTDPKEPLFNRVISGQYPTGSTIKPLVAAGVLAENLISPSKKISCQGKITVPHEYDPEIIYQYNDWRTHGPTDMRKAIAESCNIYFYTVGGGYKNQEGLGPTRIKKYLELFGWGEFTGIDLPGEAKGFIPSPEWKREVKKEGWWDGDTYHLAIGQGDISVTPLQVASAFGAIANGGTLYKPKAAKAIIDSDKNIIEEIEPEILRKDFIDPEKLKIVREGMKMAVSGEGAPYASAVLLSSLPVEAAAKTGTAQTPKPNYYHNWIAVFAPYEDPQIVLAIMIENVKGMQAVVLPIAQEVLGWYFSQ